MEEELFVPYNIALLAKENGFDEKCFGRYFASTKAFEVELEVIKDSMSVQHILRDSNSKFIHANAERLCVAPMYQQLINWFRKEKGIAVFVNHWNKNFMKDIMGNDEWEACVDIIERPQGELSYHKFFSDYKEAMDNALEEAFKLIN